MKKIKNILLVEDDPICRFLATRIIKKNFKEAIIHNCEHGGEAIDFLKNHNPDLILLDLNLPIINGWGVLEELRKIEEKHIIPIYVLTSSVAREDRDRADSFSFISGFISKPINQMKIDEFILKSA